MLHLIPEQHGASETFIDELELNPDLITTNPYFSSSWLPLQSTSVPDYLHDFPFSPAIGRADADPQPPPSPSVMRHGATVADAAMPKRIVKDDHKSNIGRKGSAGRDRHRKIHTANGPRDRRMRLSLDVARKFFDLQDLLGLDKPSKTVQWLLDMSKAAIKELIMAVSAPKICNSLNNGSTNEEPAISEDISSISYLKGKPAVFKAAADTSHDQLKRPKSRRSANKASEKAAINPVLRKVSRDRARARARERTKGKRRMNFLTSSISFMSSISEESSSQYLNSSTCRSNKQHGRNSEVLQMAFDSSNQTATASLNDTAVSFFQRTMGHGKNFLG